MNPAADLTLTAANPVAGAAATVFDVGSTIISGILNANATEKANKENLAFAEEQRRDMLAGRKAEMDFAKTQEAFRERSTLREEGVKKEQTGYERAVGAYKNIADQLNQQMSLNAQKAKPFLR